MTRPDCELGFATARLEIVIRRYGFAAEPVLWQIVIRAGGVVLGSGVRDVDGHAAVPTTTTSPVWRRWPNNVFPAAELGFAVARLETEIRLHAFDAEPVL